MKQPPPMHSFILMFCRMAIAFNCCMVFGSNVSYEMKHSPPTRCRTVSKDLETVYTLFHLNETIPLSLVITLLPCHQICLCGFSFNENETAIGTGLMCMISMTK
uniref:Secreted protein n=1 Tax=Arundo donax TaxID=35708 RepID=A0A0A8XRF8_ARUDO